jgi:hypothetical protein
MRRKIECRLTVRGDGVGAITRAKDILDVVGDCKDFDVLMEVVPLDEGVSSDRDVLNAIRESGYPGAARELLKPPTLFIEIECEGVVHKKAIPSKALKATKVLDPLRSAIISMMHFPSSVAPVHAPSPAANSMWRWKPVGWVEPKSGPGSTTCYCRLRARAELANEMRAGKPVGSIELLPDVSDVDVDHIIEMIRAAMKRETADNPHGMQYELTKAYTRSEQLAYFTAMRVANHSAALRVVKAFPGSARAIDLAKELDPWAEY